MHPNKPHMDGEPKYTVCTSSALDDAKPGVIRRKAPAHLDEAAKILWDQLIAKVQAGHRALGGIVQLAMLSSLMLLDAGVNSHPMQGLAAASVLTSKSTRQATARRVFGLHKLDMPQSRHSAVCPELYCR